MPFGEKKDKTETYLTNSQWIVPYGVTAVTFECWGAGGSGARSDGSGGGGGGGGGGAYAKKTISGLTFNDIYTISVGAGGSSNGFSSYVLEPGWHSESESICLAKGGYGGTLRQTGMTCISGSIGDIVYSGGTGGNGAVGYGGGGGEGAGIHSNGNSGFQLSGGTGSDGGYGGNGYHDSVSAENGDNYGGGGGGGINTAPGDGGNGKVVLTYGIIENEILNSF